MKQLRIGLVGSGFISPHHLGAIRRTGLADVTAIATSKAAAARAHAKQLGIEKSTGDWRALCAGHKHGLTLEIGGARASLRWEQERPDDLWLGHRNEPNQLLRKDPPLLDPAVRPCAALPGGHAEAWPDAFRNLMRNLLGFVAAGRDPREADETAFPTFATGLRIARIVDAIAASARAGGRWRSVKSA